MNKGEKRRAAVSGVRRKRASTRKEGAPKSSTARPTSRKPKSNLSQTGKTARPQTRKTKIKTSQKRQRSKTSKRNSEKHGPMDPMTSPYLQTQDFKELRKLEQLFLENQTVLRNLMPAQQEATKLTPPPSRRSGISLPQSRSGLMPASRSAVVVASRSGQIHPSRSGAALSSKSGTRSKSGITNNKPLKSKEDANADLISNSVRYIAREWIGMKIMNDFIPSKKVWA